MESNLFRYIWTHSRRDQVIVLALVLGSLPFYFAAFDVPKMIVNEAIQGRSFADGRETAAFLVLGFTIPEILGGGRIQLFEGFQLARMPLLFALSSVFLVLVLINGGFKFVINTAKGIIGERMLRRMRFDLVNLVLRFRPEEARAVKPSEIVSIVKDEVEPIGGFIGDAFIQPAFLIMQAFTAVLFILLQSFWLGMIAVAVVAIQGFVIPELRKEQLRLSRERQIEQRKFAGRVGEFVEIAPAIHDHAAAAYVRSDIGHRLGTLFDIRVELFKRKFAVKYLNNLLAQVTPFFFYAIGGYLVVMERMDIGQLVAVIAAYKELPPPIKDLIDWDQQRADAMVKYQQVVDQFPEEALLGEKTLQPDPPADSPLVLSGLRAMDRNGQSLLDPLSLSIERPSHVALVGGTGSGRDILARILGRQISLHQGTARLGDLQLDKLPDAAARRIIGYAGPDPLLFQASIRTNLLFALNRAEEPPVGDAPDKAEKLRRTEAARSGNPQALPSADWLDPALLPAMTAPERDAALMTALADVGLAGDVSRLGLQGRIDPAKEPEVAAALLAGRHEIRAEIAARGLGKLVEPFDAERFNNSATIAENLLFGVRLSDRLADDAMAADPFVRAVLEAEALILPLATVGLSMASTVVEVFADLPHGHPLFERFSFVRAEMLPEFQRAIAAAELKGGVRALGGEDRALLIGLALGYVESRHRLGLIDDLLKARIIRARRSLRRHLPASHRALIDFYDADHYLASAKVLDNLIFGRIVYGQPQAEERLTAVLREMLEAKGLFSVVDRLGLDHDVGVAGRALYPPQRAALALARHMVAPPTILVVDGALASLGGAQAASTLRRLRERMRDRTLICAFA
ncbi:MAG: ABC transporter transmembrane domain-containing protein, partial [Beijerinckiaceae bacterium]